MEKTLRTTSKPGGNQRLSLFELFPFMDCSLRFVKLLFELVSEPQLKVDIPVRTPTAKISLPHSSPRLTDCFIQMETCRSSLPLTEIHLPQLILLRRKALLLASTSNLPRFFLLGVCTSRIYRITTGSLCRAQGKLRWQGAGDLGTSTRMYETPSFVF